MCCALIEYNRTKAPTLTPSPSNRQVRLHQQVFADCIVMVNERVAEENKKAEMLQERMQERRVKTLAWRQRRLRVFEQEQAQVCTNASTLPHALVL
jgi:tellurite resistance protein